MTLPNQPFNRVEDTGGRQLAGHRIGNEDYPVVMEAGPSGHIHGSLPSYTLTIPPQAVGANKVHFDLFNNSALLVKLRGIYVIVAGDVAVTGLVNVRLDWYRTSAAGTGGATVARSSATIASTFSPKNTDNPALDAGITARTVPTGGAAASQWLFPSYHQTEETQPGTFLSQFQDLLFDAERGEQDYSLETGQGIKAIQGSVAGVGNIGFFITFTTE